MVFLSLGVIYSKTWFVVHQDQQERTTFPNLGMKGLEYVTRWLWMRGMRQEALPVWISITYILVAFTLGLCTLMTIWQFWKIWQQLCNILRHKTSDDFLLSSHTRLAIEPPSILHRGSMRLSCLGWYISLTVLTVFQAVLSLSLAYILLPFCYSKPSTSFNLLAKWDCPFWSLISKIPMEHSNILLAWNMLTLLFNVMLEFIRDQLKQTGHSLEGDPGSW